MRFIADNTVGKLRRWLSLLGYDVVHDPRPAREILRALREPGNAARQGENAALEPAASISAASEGASRRLIVLGRCPTLAEEEGAREAAETAIGVEASSVEPGAALGPRFLHIVSPRLPEQIAQVARAFALDFSKTLFSRCSCCNLELIGPMPLEAVAPKVPPLVREWRTAYYRCPGCERVYWDGTHTEHVRDFLRNKAGLSL